MEHQYPKGAVQSQETIEQALQIVFDRVDDAIILFGVHGLGEQSFLSEYKLTRGHALQHCHIGWSVRKTKSDWSEFFLGDFNIGGHHNHHYIFTDEEDAKAYLEYAIVNTDDIRNDDWDDCFDPWFDSDYPD